MGLRKAYTGHDENYRHQHGDPFEHHVADAMEVVHSFLRRHGGPVTEVETVRDGAWLTLAHPARQKRALMDLIEAQLGLTAPLLRIGCGNGVHDVELLAACDVAVLPSNADQRAVGALEQCGHPRIVRTAAPHGGGVRLYLETVLNQHETGITVA